MKIRLLPLFLILGTWLLSSLSSPAETVTATFNAATDVPVTASGYTATGNSVNITLIFAPTVGTQLMVVKNTGQGFIQGLFTNLSQGQMVPLTYAGSTYNFVANYYGGSGNDLVLQWAGTKAFSWGSNTYGQLGNHTTTNGSVPLAAETSGVLLGKTVIAVAAGSSHSLALCADGTLAAWGYNNYGQLGNGGTTDSNAPVAVVQSGVLSGKTVIAIAAGSSHSLALCSDGTLAAWGNNGSGRLGDGSTAQSYVPVAVNQTGVLASKSIIAVAAGDSHSLALCSDGTLAAWGNGGLGMLGTGNSTSSPVPVLVNTTGVLSGKTVIGVAAGNYHSLALCSDGTAAAWGYNAYGQLGNNSTATSSNVPVEVDRTGVLAGKTVVAVADGSYHGVALCSDGSLAAWGYNTYGQLGDGSTTNSKVPVAVDRTGMLAGKSAVAVAAGYGHNLALCADGTLAAWGANYDGRLGDGGTTKSPVPVAVSMAGVVPGGRFVAATTSQGAYHNLGIVAEPPAPRIVVEQSAGTNLTSGASTVDFGGGTVGTGGSRTFTIRNAGALDLTGIAVAFDGTHAPDFSVTTPPAATVGPESSTTFVVAFTPGNIATRSGTLRIASNDPLTGSFTVNLTGFAVGTLDATFNTGAPIPLDTSGFVATGNTVKLTLNHAPATGTMLMVVRNAGVAFIAGTFGNLAQGQRVALSHGVLTYHFVADYYGGTGNDLVLHWADTRPLAWGANSSGPLGDNSTTQGTLPAEVNLDGVLAGKTVTATGTGASHSLALCGDGTVAAWGGNLYGQLGNHGTAKSQVPVAIDQTGTLAGKTVVAVAAGSYHNLALCADGTVAAWGRGLEGQLGNNLPANALVPVAVNRASGVSALAGKTVVAIAAGAYHSLALCSDGTVAAWGYNPYGQLGDNSTVQRYVPVAVSKTSGLSAFYGRSVIAIAAGEFHSLALCADGQLTAWGLNGSGQLGDGSTTARTVPVPVNAAAGSALYLNPVTSIAAGQAHCLALCADGTLAAWGANHHGQLGDDSTAQRNVPVAVNTAGVLSHQTVVAVAAGASHSLALCADGTLATWGMNGNGQLGDTTTTQHNVPVGVSTAGLSGGGRFVAGNSGQGSAHCLALAAAPFAPLTAVESWRQTHFGSPANSGDGADLNDFDRDGIPNLAEFAFGLNPKANSAGLLPIPQKIGDNFVISFTEPNGVSGITYGAEWSTTLLPDSWTPVADTGTLPQHVFSVPIGSHPKLFMRLKVTNPNDAGTTTPLQQWRQTHFGSPANSGDGADLNDFDKDGIPNVIEFAFGLHPKQNSAGPLPQPQRIGNNLVISFPRPTEVSGITYGAEWSSTMAPATWLPISDTGNPGASPPQHTFSVPIGNKDKLYMRLKVTSP